MERNEVRYGNIVNYRGQQTIMNQTELGHFLRFPETYEGMELTEEWLLKFGFVISYESEFRKKLDFKENTQFGYDFNKIGKGNGMHGFIYYGRYHKCEYVHQLQNLYFALTNEELKLI